MKIFKYIFVVIGIGTICFLFKDIFTGFYYHLSSFSQLSFWQWILITFIGFNFWLWKYNHKHPALKVIWNYLSRVYKIITLAFMLKYVDNRFFHNKNKQI